MNSDEWQQLVKEQVKKKKELKATIYIKRKYKDTKMRTERKDIIKEQRTRKEVHKVKVK